MGAQATINNSTANRGLGLCERHLVVQTNHRYSTANNRGRRTRSQDERGTRSMQLESC